MYKNGSPVTMSVSAVGSGSLSYQWKKEGNDITQSEFTGINTSYLKISSFKAHKHQGS